MTLSAKNVKPERGFEDVPGHAVDGIDFTATES
jgi:hypothetical protein